MFAFFLLSILLEAAFSFSHMSLMQNGGLNLILQKAEGIMGSHSAFSSHAVDSVWFGLFCVCVF